MSMIKMYSFMTISYFLDHNRETLPGGISIFLLGSSLNCTSSHWCFFKVEHSVIYIWYKYPIFLQDYFAGFYDIFVLEMILQCWRICSRRGNSENINTRINCFLNFFYWVIKTVNVVKLNMPVWKQFSFQFPHFRCSKFIFW